MLVSNLPFPAGGQGVSMDRWGGPVLSSGTRGGKKSWTFEITVTEVTADVCNERAWSHRARRIRDNHKVATGPIFHHADGAIGCIATPIKFVLEPQAPYGGINLDRMMVTHDYFVLDVGGEFRGMGKTERRSEESASLNRLLLCQHANRLRSRGAKFTPNQVKTIDFYINALLRSLPSMPDDEEDDEEDVHGEEEAEGSEEENPSALGTHSCGA